MISVIIPVYKVEPFLNRCVDSVLAQTYQNLEIILVDDGSPDSCGSICDGYAKKDPRVKVIHRQNGGLSAARNTGIEAATGSYIAFLDSDDWVEPWAYGKLRELSMEYDADIAEGALRYYRPWKPERLYNEGKNTKAIHVYDSTQALERLYFGLELHSDISISVCTKLYRTELLQNVRFLEGHYHEDVEFTPRVLFKANRIVKYDDSFYNYNIHLGADSISAQQTTVPVLASLLEVRKQVYLFFQEHALPGISEYTLESYLYSMIYVYCCGRDLKSQEGKQLIAPLHREFRLLYRRIKKRPLTFPRSTFRMFLFSPGLLYWIKQVHKKLKQLRKRK